MARITKAQASKYERGQQRPTLDSLDRVLMALGVDLVELAGVIDEIRHADRLRQEASDELPEAERRRAERRRVRTELVRGFERYLERLEESLEESSG
jgi:transcriptional regulator with XRE-family HTH domain